MVPIKYDVVDRVLGEFEELGGTVEREWHPHGRNGGKEGPYLPS